MTKSISERALYCQLMSDLLRGEGSLALLQKPGFADDPAVNRALLQQWCYGVCRWFHRLEGIALVLLERPLRRKDLDIYSLILLGLYQLYFLQTAEHAAVNEAVAATETLKKPWAKGLINGVLREALRKREELEARASRDYAQWYSHPEWLLNRIKQDWPANYRDILEANNIQAPMTLRVNLAKISRDSCLASLQAAGIVAVSGLYSHTAITLEKPMPVMDIPGFAEGLVSVQDEASQLVSTFLPLRPGLRVLDACAAPGGKTCALLEAEPELSLLALDIDAGRLVRVRENLDRLGLAARVETGDITTANSPKLQQFDAILLDAPCSGTGVIRRHPDIKILRTPAEVSALKEKQRKLLQAAWPLLADKGCLLYSTCSVLREENEHQIAAFLDTHPDARLIQTPISGLVPGDCGVQLFPRAGGNDGFYYALLQK
jgi:16S rRNA (cytosine967-C5)-methyltransferase